MPVKRKTGKSKQQRSKPNAAKPKGKRRKRQHWADSGINVPLWKRKR